MDLKDYQRRVVDELRAFFREVRDQRAANPAAAKYATQEVWEGLKDEWRLGAYTPARNGLGEDIPTVCVRVPTGGGKTLIATQALGILQETIHRDRGGAGLALWVVPTTQIYNDTLRRLRDRGDFYRQMLEHACGRRIELWEKHELRRLSPDKLAGFYNILVVQLGSINRRNAKDQLKFFEDTSGEIVRHFPPETDLPGHQLLKDRFDNLELIGEDDGRGDALVRTSVANLVKMNRPAVILDESHKGNTELARKTIRERFNASAVIELSATPRKDANVLCRVSGKELLDEEMIKLPINVASAADRTWQDVVTLAHEKRRALAAKADELAALPGTQGRRPIRPIVLVQVERTGKDQRGGDLIHADHVAEFLTGKLGVPGHAVRVKSSGRDDIEGVDLLAEGCPVEWIITVRALQEGWDCPFAYVLVSLLNSKSQTTITQLVGRVLRQPDQTRTPFPELNESYVYCLHRGAAEIAKQVKRALLKVGYEGDAANAVVIGDEAANAAAGVRADVRDGVRSLYPADPDRGPKACKIYLPRFCVRDGDGGGWEPFDYYSHLVSRADTDAFDASELETDDRWDLRAAAAADSGDVFFRLDLNEDLAAVDGEDRFMDAGAGESDDAARAWVCLNLDFPQLGFKHLRRLVARAHDRLLAAGRLAPGELAGVKLVARDRLADWIDGQLHRQTEAAFYKLHDAGRLQFRVECVNCRVQLPPSVKLSAPGGRVEPLVNAAGDLAQRTLFEKESADAFDSEPERRVALCLDRDVRVLWWYRNRVGTDQFAIDGYRPERIFPDLLVQHAAPGGGPDHKITLIESKGEHLAGNRDSRYKNNVARVYSEVGRQVTWQQLSEDLGEHTVTFHVLEQSGDGDGRGCPPELLDLLTQVCGPAGG